MITGAMIKSIPTFTTSATLKDYRAAFDWVQCVRFLIEQFILRTHQQIVILIVIMAAELEMVMKMMMMTVFAEAV